MKYALKDNMQIDCFSDGEMVVYDQITEVTHVLNITAAMILNLVIHNEDDPLDSFVKNIQRLHPDVPIAKLEEDFRNMISNFLESKIIIIR